MESCRVSSGSEAAHHQRGGGSGGEGHNTRGQDGVVISGGQWTDPEHHQE